MPTRRTPSETSGAWSRVPLPPPRSPRAAAARMMRRRMMRRRLRGGGARAFRRRERRRGGAEAAGNGRNYKEEFVLPHGQVLMRQATRPGATVAATGSARSSNRLLSGDGGGGFFCFRGRAWRQGQRPGGQGKAHSREKTLLTKSKTNRLSQSRFGWCMLSRTPVRPRQPL